MVTASQHSTRNPAAHDELEQIAEVREWMKSQPGFRSAWNTFDSKSGKSLSISVWDDMPSLMAMTDRVFIGKTIAVRPDKVETYDETYEL